MLVNGEWELTPERVAIHLPSATAVLADLHLGYHAARRRRGEAVPLPTLDDLLAPLAQILRLWSLSRVVVAGDLFEDGVDPAVVHSLHGWLRRHETKLFAVVPGNHDRGLADGVPGIEVYPEGYCLQSWLVVHGDRPIRNRTMVCGHWHPSLRIGLRHYPCYLLGKRRLLLPAYCSEARGVSVKTFRTWQLDRCFVPVDHEVLDFGKLQDVRNALGGRKARSHG